MAISARLKAFLKASRITYTAAKHPVVYTAQEIAASQHVPGRQLAKSVLVKTNSGSALAVLPAIYLTDFKKLKATLKAKTVSMAKESDIKAAFPDIEVGAMSPFGNLYQVPVVVDKNLEGSEYIVFNAGSHTDTVRMRFKDFLTCVKPLLGAFAQLPKKKQTSKPSRKAPAKKKSAARSKIRAKSRKRR